MRKRVILLIAGVAVLALAAAAPVLLALTSTPPDPYKTPVPFAWTLQLRGPRNINLSKHDFNAFRALKNHQAVIVVDENKPATPDAADDTTYRGVPLWRIVGLIDDKNPATFNTKLATTGVGYGVEVMAVEYFSYVYTSQQIAALGDSLIVAGTANGAPLTWGSVKVSGPTGTFKPNWPLKLVSGDSSVTGKMKPGGIVRISIVAPPPAPSPFPSVSPSGAPAPF